MVKNLAYKQLIIGLNILVQTGSHTGSGTEKNNNTYTDLRLPTMHMQEIVAAENHRLTGRKDSIYIAHCGGLKSVDYPQSVNLSFMFRYIRPWLQRLVY